MLKVGMTAPDFTLSNQEGNLISRSDFVGKTVVLYFYPKDDTPGCTKQACHYRDAYDEFAKRNAVVIGISKDSVRSHGKFSEKYQLPFILLADPDLTAIQAYDVWQEKKLYGKTYMGVVRSTYIIDANGTITHVFENVKPDTDTEAVLAALDL